MMVLGQKLRETLPRPRRKRRISHRNRIETERRRGLYK